MLPSQIKPQCTYVTVMGVKFYVQDITGQIVTYSPLGHISRGEMALGRFAAMVAKQVENE